MRGNPGRELFAKKPAVKKPPTLHKCSNCKTKRQRTELFKSKTYDRYLCKEGCVSTDAKPASK
jgi:hypothetical protein